MRKILMAGNWKMHKSLAELPAFFEAFAKEAGLASKLVTERVDVLFAVPYPLLAGARSIAAPLGIAIAAQNVHWEPSGAYTGEVSLGMLKEIGITSAIIGHSERRQYFGETDQTVAAKAKACLEQGVTPIACLGETKSEREEGKTESVIRRQLAAILGAISAPESLVIAYEPVWAIGTGLTATSAQAQEVHALIRSEIRAKWGADVADSLRILYGGSAKPDNIGELLAQPDIDGGLVGGASLKPAEFAAMVRTAFEKSK